MAHLDGLTQVANRRHFNQCLQQQWQNCLKSQQGLALILLDVDYFKLYNDHYGHLAGDDGLQRIAQGIQQGVEAVEGLVARYGGEEFAVILPRLSLEEAITVAKLIQRAIAAQNLPHTPSPISQLITLSIGLASQIPTPETTPDQLIQNADQSLYEAKRLGRNQICYES
ncbi:GGDEF domain-containing protein [Spirulina sp. CS-785/01]|uniref:diguanylate cyclase n=1 Tax=Spirulina sp. CS-785/01 TaxID=3021716 RepID=UPI00232C27BA|nr:diguanylate cyclase [Spirulina sp. CS-785/01]MDB9312925.1 GGDEF domain-containing protein [Spirulina sp. CS-785/01]